MKLYEISDLLTSLFERFEEIENYEPDTNADGQPVDGNGNVIENVGAYKDKMFKAWFDTLEGIEGEFDYKAEQIGAYIKQLKYEADMLKAEKIAIANRQSQKEKEAKKLTDYLVRTMQKVGKNSIDMPMAKLNLKKNPSKVMVDNELAFINWAQNNNDNLLKYSLPEIRKNDVKALLKSGENLPYVHMEQETSLNIK